MTLGWREWIELPSLGVPWIKTKIDTGARTSSLHAENLTYCHEAGRTLALFSVHPRQRSLQPHCRCEAEVLEFRQIRSSNGIEEIRPVIAATVRLLGQTWQIELTLTNRDQMGFRMLLGRQALRGRFLVDPGRSYCTGSVPESRRFPRSAGS
jgi:hypothetical protein